LTTDLLEIPVASTGPPPGSLTGLPCTGTAEAAVCVDWFSCTFAVQKHWTVDGTVSWFLQKAGYLIDDQEMLDYGKFGYSRLMRINEGALLMWNPERAEMGVHLEIPSSAFGSFLAAGDTIEGLIDFLVNDLRGKPTRLDIAFDDFAGLLQIDEITRWCESGWFTSKWQIMRSENEFRHSVGSMLPRGRIIRFGRRTSKSYARIYDKHLEQIATGKACEHEHWHRVEIEFKGVKAEAATRLLFADDRPDKLRGVLLGHLDFKSPSDTDSNTRRWDTTDWWLRFLNNVGKVQLGIPKPSRSVEKTGKWMENCLLPSIALVVEAMTDGNREREIEYFDKIVADGKARWKEQEARMLRDYRREHG